MKKRVVFIVVLMTALLQSVSSLAFNGPRGQLLAGAAKEDITPELKDLPSTSQGILDHCYVRVIAFGNGATKAAFVTFDAGGVNSDVAAYIDERAAKELGIPEGNIIYNGTHTHSGGSVRGDELNSRTWTAVKKAVDAMVPAKLGYGAGVSYLNVKRDLFDAERGSWWEGPDYDGKSDKTVGVIYFESLDGKPIATYFNYAMHAVITGNTDKVSADFPGATERYVESRYGDSFVASFASGAAGDQNPIYFQQTFDLRNIRIADYAARGEDISNQMPPGGQGLDRTKPEVQRLLGEQERMIESYGQILGEEVKYVIMNMRHFETQVTINCARLGYLSKGDEDALYKRLDELLDLAKTSLEIKRQTIALMQNRTVANFDVTAVLQCRIFGKFKGHARQRILVLHHGKRRVKNAKIALEILMNTTNIQYFLEFLRLIRRQQYMALLRKLDQRFDSQ